MEPTDRELIGRLFAFSTALLEDSHIRACEGQSQTLTRKQYALKAQSLAATAANLSALAATITLILETANSSRGSGRRSG